jgi:hypothetical protein
MTEPNGTDSPHSKLTDEQAREIVRRRATGETISALGQDYGVARGTIRNALEGGE